MLIFAGLDEDKADERSAKLKALKEYFQEPNEPRAWQLLGPTDLSKSNGSRGKNLIVNSHGSRDNFAGMDARAFCNKLAGNGFGPGSFEKVYLMACFVGEQDQAGTILTNFARDLYRVFAERQITSGTKLYAPRGTLNYEVTTKTELGQTYYVVTRTYIWTPEREYPLSEGLLLVQP